MGAHDAYIYASLVGKELMERSGVVLLWRFGLAVAWGVVFCEVRNHCGCGCEGGCCGITVEDGDDCGWWCVLKGVAYGCVVWFVVGVVGKM